MITFAANIKEMGKLTVKYIASNKCKSIPINGVDLFAVYIQITLHRKTTQFAFVECSQFGNLFANENGIKALNGETPLMAADFYTNNWQYQKQDENGKLTNTINLNAISNRAKELEKDLNNIVNYYETTENKAYKLGKRNILNDISRLKYDAVGLLLTALFSAKFGSQLINKALATDTDTINICNGTIAKYLTNGKSEPVLNDVVIHIIGENPNLYVYYKELFNKWFAVDIDMFFNPEFIADWQYISNLAQNKYISFIDWFGGYDGKNQLINQLIKEVNKWLFD